MELENQLMNVQIVQIDLNNQERALDIKLKQLEVEAREEEIKRQKRDN